MQENWKPVVGYENLYEVSDKGRIRSVERTLEVQREGQRPYLRKYGGGILKPKKSKWGYLLVDLSKNGESKTKSVHRLVLSAFVENENNYPCINHKDENKENNSLNNLEWCTHQYNSRYGTGIERCVKHKRKAVLQIKDGEIVKRWESTNEAGRNGYTQSSVSQCCRGIRSHHKGFEWKYE